MEASRLKDYLKARENDANKPWNKPQWPGPKVSISPLHYILIEIDFS